MALKSLNLTTLFTIALVLPVWAHHSHGQYQTAEYTHLEGTVEQIRWMNPHSWIYLEVVDDESESAVWALEGGSLPALARKGWKREDIQVGDHIKVRFHRLRDNSNGGLLGFVTPKDGVEREFD